jgi:hypothetical protein
MMNERERLEEDLQDLDSTLESIDDEMRIIERQPDYEDSDHWNHLMHEYNETTNAISYIEHCLEDL